MHIKIKWIYILFVIIGICPYKQSFSQLNSTKTLIGKWVSARNAKGGMLNFIDNTNVEITYPDGSVNNCTYQIDFTKNPAWFDIINQTRTQHDLMEIINDSTFNWYISKDGSRPINYSHPSIIFKKKK